MNNLPTNDADFNLQQVLQMMNHLSKWLIRSGVGYTDFTNALKPIFYQQALQEIKRIEGKPTISAISLLSGLHRKDVTTFKAQLREEETSFSNHLSIPARVLNTWIIENWPVEMAFFDIENPSFTVLSQQVSTEMHPRAILNELVRLGIVKQENDRIFLQKKSFIPDPSTQEIRKLLSCNLQSHMAAGIHNIFLQSGNTFLEESIRANELTQQSVQILVQHSIELWEKYSEEILKLALERCDLDKDKSEATHTFCLGIYQSDL